MWSILEIIWAIVQVIIGFNLVFPLFLYCIYCLRKRASGPKLESDQELDFAVVITAYQYIDTLPDVVESSLKLDYSNYLVYVVADNCDVSTLNFNDERVVLLRPEEVLRGNTKSHFYAIKHFRRAHDVITIIDSDNIIDPAYLKNLNPYFQQGFEAVQGPREAKNLDTTYARLDAARDIYYHFFDCKILFNCGSSSTLSGSGMAFTTQLYKDCLENERIEGAGFDKVLQARILERNKRIAFAEEAVVFDQKTSKPEELVNQRSRWINTWFKYFSLGFTIAYKGLRNFSINQVLFGLVLLRPPLFVFLLLSMLMLLINLFVSPMIAAIWLLGFIVFVSCFFLALSKSKPDKRIYEALTGIPKFVFYQLISLTKIRRANVRSVSTRHSA